MGRNEEPRRAKSKHAMDDGKPKIFGKIIIIFILLIVIVIGLAFFWYNMSLEGTGESSETVTFKVEYGSGKEKIIATLKEKDLIKNELAFKIYIKLNKISNFQAGEYTLSKDMTAKEIAEALQKGILFKDSYNITFVEGKTFKYVAKTIADNTNNTEEEVYAILKNEEYIDNLISKYWFITEDIKNKDIYYSLEGYLFPDTYAFESKDVTVKEIFNAMLDQMEKVLNPYKEKIRKRKI